MNNKFQLPYNEIHASKEIGSELKLNASIWMCAFQDYLNYILSAAIEIFLTIIVGSTFN